MAVIGLGEACCRFGVVAFEYGRELGQRLLLARRDNVGCGHCRAPFVAWVFS